MTWRSHPGAFFPTVGFNTFDMTDLAWELQLRWLRGSADADASYISIGLGK